MMKTRRGFLVKEFVEMRKIKNCLSPEMTF